MYRKNGGMYLGKTRFLCAVGCASAKSNANPPPKPGPVCSFVVLLPARSLEKTSLSIPGGKNDREEFVECPAYRESGWLVAGLLGARELDGYMRRRLGKRLDQQAVRRPSRNMMACLADGWLASPGDAG